MKQNHLQMARGSVLHRGEDSVTNRKLLACNQPNTVLGWLDTIGGTSLIKHICHVFSQDLAINTLHDIRVRIMEHINTLTTEPGKSSEAFSMRPCRICIPSSSTISPVSLNWVQDIVRGNGQICRPPTKSSSSMKSSTFRISSP